MLYKTELKKDYDGMERCMVPAFVSRDKMETVSVIMPCYNDGQYIMQAIDSVINQTYINIEIVVVDDGSDEKSTIEIICQLEKKVTVLRTEHLGPAGARNYGIRHAKGKYILPVDADDMIDKTYVEKCVAILENNAAIGVVYCKADLFGEKSGAWELPAYSFKDMLVDNIVFVTAMFRKEDWEMVGGFDLSMDKGMEDYSFWLSILGLGKEIYQIPETLFHYRIKKKSRTSEFLGDVEEVKKIYRKIFYAHHEFYSKHADEYMLILRDALMEQMYVRRMYEKRFEKFQVLKKIPIIGWGIKKFFNGG